ncbi:nuclear pore complex subunit [Cryptotrichosporon argae]
MSTSRPAPSTLSSLLAKANSLNTDVDPELPAIRLGIDEIERMSEAVAGRGRRAKSARGEGHTLLSNLGINTSQLAHTISNLPAPEPADAQAGSTSGQKRRRRRRLPALGDMGPSYAVGDADVGAWGRNWHEMVILSGIEVQRQKTVKAFQTQFQTRILQSWEAEKARILQDELGVTDDELARLSGADGLGKSRLGASTRRFPMAQQAKSSVEAREGGLVMHNKAMKYERVVSELNQKRLRSEPYELCQALEASVKGDQKQPLLPTAFRILAHLTQEPSLRDDPGHAEPVQERQYAQAYLEAKGTHGVLLRGRLVQGGRRFLERDFETHMDETIARNPKEAALGGVPGIKNKVRAYVDVTLRSKEAAEAFHPETVDGIPLWAHVYYLLRVGHAADALSLVEERQHSIRKDDWSFPGAFKTFLSSAERRLPRAQRDQLANDFNAHVRHSATADQFKLALYKLVGRLDMARKSVKVAATTEDWVWFQLGLVRENKDVDAPTEQYDLADLGRLVVKYGSEKFDQNGQRPFAWFDLLLLTAQFERAVAYLYAKPTLRVDAVHFALALQYYGLLRVSSRTDAEIFTDDAEHPNINYARLVHAYIAPLSRAEPVLALQYAYTVALGADGASGDAQRRAALDLVRDIVVAAKGWGKLLGSVRADGTKETGVVERDLKLLKLADEQDYLRSVVLTAAEGAAADPSLADAVELYHLAGAYDRVVETVNRALGHALAQPGSVSASASRSTAPAQTQAGGAGGSISGAFGGAGNDVYALAARVHEVYARDFAKRSRVDARAWETLQVLLKLRRGLAEFYADRPDLALETIRSTCLLPLNNEDASSIAGYAARFKALLDDPAVPSLDDAIVVAMKCLHRLSRALRDSPYGDHARQQELARYRHHAQSLVQFASALRLRLGPDVYRQLSSMSAFF